MLVVNTVSLDHWDRRGCSLKLDWNSISFLHKNTFYNVQYKILYISLLFCVYCMVIITFTKIKKCNIIISVFFCSVFFSRWCEFSIGTLWQLWLWYFVISVWIGKKKMFVTATQARQKLLAIVRVWCQYSVHSVISWSYTSNHCWV